MPHAHTTVLLQESRRGDARAADLLFGEVYDELRRLSQNRINAEPGVVTLSATGLVHEAYIRLIDHDGYADRGHFLAVASRAMRRVLTDRARARNAEKRGGSDRAVTLDAELAVAADEASDHILAVDAALDRLAALDARLGEVVEMRFFGGLTVEEVAEALEVSPRTAARLWAQAKGHLHGFLA